VSAVRRAFLAGAAAALASQKTIRQQMQLQAFLDAPYMRRS
jgi:hypothetical protein